MASAASIVANPPPCLRCWPFALVTALAASSVLAQAAGLTDLGKLNGGSSSSMGNAVTSDGVVVGYANDGSAGNQVRAFRWTSTGGLQSLGVLNGGVDSAAYGVNADGTVIVGTASDGAAANQGRAFRWTAAGGMVSLGVLNGGTASVAYGVNADGSVVVGASLDGAAGNVYRAFRWTAGGGMVGLGVLNGGNWSVARAVSEDGDVVVGAAKDGAAGNAARAFRWTQAGGMVNLGVLNGGTLADAQGVSADGNVVVGYAYDGAAGNADRAFRWTQAVGMASLGVLNGGTTSSAYAANRDGSVVVGVAADGAAGNTSRGFRWTQTAGMQTVEAWLRSTGVTSLSTTTASAIGVSADGNVVTGQLSNGNPYVARAGSGLITVADVQNSLGVSTASSGMVLAATSTVLNGAHSRPLASRVAPGRNAVWLAGDWGRDDHGSRKGGLGLAEVGIGRNFKPMQINVSVGQTWTRQNLVLDGRAEADGHYLLTEALIPLGGGLWATLGGYGHAGRADLRRGYLNAGLLDASAGRPKQRSHGVRLRLDWEDAATLAGARMTPYVDLNRNVASIDAYTETGGGFPARFEARTETMTDLRVGAQFLRALAGGARLTGVLEAAHRFEKAHARAAGEIVGLFAFDMAGEPVKRDWVRAGVGVETPWGDGVASVMFNMTTRGEVPSAWLAAAWNKAF